MKLEWRNNVFLARSKIQGLGLYAARDLEKHTMVIEYIGEVIRGELSELREKQYEAKVRFGKIIFVLFVFHKLFILNFRTEEFTCFV